MSAARHSRREAVAFALNTDIADVSGYQPGRTRVPVFLVDGRGPDYFVALRDGEYPPRDFPAWSPVGAEFGYRILKAEA